MRLLVGGGVVHLREIENQHVRERAGAQLAAILQAEHRRGQVVIDRIAVGRSITAPRSRT